MVKMSVVASYIPSNVASYIPNNVASYIPSNITSSISNMGISQYFQVVPNKFYYSLGSTFAAAAAGASYGLVGRIAFPKAGIIPHHYAIWFVLAFQMAQAFDAIEKRFHSFLKDGSSSGDADSVGDADSDLDNSFQRDHQVRKCILKVIKVKDDVVCAIDSLFSKVFNIRPFSQVTAQNVEDASFLEMCRYRIWSVFKTTVLELVCFEAGYRITNAVGFALPSRASISLFLVIHSVVQGIIMIPALHIYARFYADLAAAATNAKDKQVYEDRLKWFRSVLPSL